MIERRPTGCRSDLGTGFRGSICAARARAKSIGAGTSWAWGVSPGVAILANPDATPKSVFALGCGRVPALEDGNCPWRGQPLGLFVWNSSALLAGMSRIDRARSLARWKKRRLSSSSSSLIDLASRSILGVALRILPSMGLCMSNSSVVTPYSLARVRMFSAPGMFPDASQRVIDDELMPVMAWSSIDDSAASSLNLVRCCPKSVCLGRGARGISFGRYEGFHDWACHFLDFLKKPVLDFTRQMKGTKIQAASEADRDRFTLYPMYRTADVQHFRDTVRAWWKSAEESARRFEAVMQSIRVGMISETEIKRELRRLGFVVGSKRWVGSMICVNALSGKVLLRFRAK